MKAETDQLWLVAIGVQETLEKKMEIIATRIYGAEGIELSEEARKKVDLYTKQVKKMSWKCYCRLVVWSAYINKVTLVCKMGYSLNRWLIA